MNFLKLRFPAFLGMNVLYSLALFGVYTPFFFFFFFSLKTSANPPSFLLFVFLFFPKRGREVRLEKERLLTEAEFAALNDNNGSTSSSDTTTAPEGAPIDEVQAGLHASEAQEGSASYAPGGSLAKELAREKAEAAAKAKEADNDVEAAEKEKAPAAK